MHTRSTVWIGTTILFPMFQEQYTLASGSGNKQEDMAFSILSSLLSFCGHFNWPLLDRSMNKMDIDMIQQALSVLGTVLSAQ